MNTEVVHEKCYRAPTSAHVLTCLEKTLDLLEEVAECLRKEREHITFFEVTDLMKTLEDKDRLLREHMKHGKEQQAILTAYWQENAPSEPMPEDIVELLATLASRSEGHLAVQFADKASEVSALRDTVGDLHLVNKSLVERAVRWISTYVNELVDTTAVQTYEMTGRLARNNRNSGMLSRMI